MRILLVGAGGVGSAFTGIAARRDFFEVCVVSDYDRGRATKAVEALGDDRFVAAQVDASSAEAVTALCAEHRITHVMNAVDPVFNMPIFDGAYAADHLFSEIDELGTRDGANLVVTDDNGKEIFAPSFSMWTTIEECLNPPVIWEDGGWHTTAPFSEPEVFDFPEGIGPVECVNV